MKPSEAGVTLVSGRVRLELSPALGGSISAFEWLGEDGPCTIMRKCETPPRKVLEACSFPLVPYVNRIRDGRFSFRGREVKLAANMPGDPSPLHGQGWLNPWTVERQNATSALLRFTHEPGEWPWAYEARQEVSVDDRGVSIRLTCRNDSSDSMPCGLGQHPYFPCGLETLLDTEVQVAWTIDDKVLPVDKVPAAGRFDLRRRAICGQDLDNGFGGWGGEARMSDPDWPYELRLGSPEASFFQVYSPPEGGIFVAEPVSHANAALNAPESEWPELGMRVLASGEEMSLDMRLEIVPKSRRRSG